MYIRWYRGQIQRVEDDKVMIFFADYGDSDEVPRDKIREFPIDKFFELPLQAIECKLNHLEEQGRSMCCFWNSCAAFIDLGEKKFVQPFENCQI